MSTIQNTDVADFETDGVEDFDAGAAFLDRFEGKDEDASKKKPSAQGNEDEADEVSEDESGSEDDTTDHEGSDEDSPETDEDGDESEETEEKAKKFVEDDDEHTFVRVKVGEETREASIKDLKRLYGQEAALTRKSQETAAARTAADETKASHLAALNVMVERAKARSEPFKKIDWIALTKDNSVSAEEVSALRAQAQEALEDEAFLSNNLTQFMQAVATEQRDNTVKAAKACVTALSTAPAEDKPNPNYIEGWNDKVYDEIRDFGVSMGLPKEIVSSITEPAAIKMMHMAMLFAKGASKVKTVKVNKTPTKIVKTSKSPVADRQPANVTERKAAVARQRKSGGKIEDTTAAFLASFGSGDDE